MTDKERKLIIPSVAAFQKGEHSEGKYFLKAAEKFAGEYKEPFYPEAVRKFIREENLHSAYLGQFMKYHDIVPGRESRLDEIFRKLRHIWGSHSETAVLLTAEIIALTYYRALGIVADSHALKLICRQMLHDELPHVIFQSYTLGHFREKTGARCIRTALLDISCTVVWLVYRRLFRRGGYTFRKFLAESKGYLRQSFMISDIKKINTEGR